MRILLAPHNDDEALFASVIIQRLRPLLLVIITDSFIQERRGDLITWRQRRQESADAAKLLDVPICFLGIPDADLSPANMREALRVFNRDDEVIAPALQGGNPQHDIVARIAWEYFHTCRQYATYGAGECFTPTESKETGINAVAVTTITPTEEEANLKLKVLACYKSQLALASTRPHFDAVTSKPEYLSGRF